MVIGANTTISTYRLEASGNVATFEASPTVSGVDAYIESPSPEMLAVLGDQAGIEVFNAHVDPGDYRIGDKVVDAEGNTYGLVALERHSGNGDADDVYTLRLHKKTAQYSDA